MRNSHSAEHARRSHVSTQSSKGAQHRSNGELRVIMLLTFNTFRLHAYTIGGQHQAQHDRQLRCPLVGVVHDGENCERMRRFSWDNPYQKQCARLCCVL